MTPTAGRSVLVITQPPHDGGVPAKARLLCEHLRDRGHAVTVAWYATFGHDSELNVPLWRAWSGARPGLANRTCFGTFPGVAVGCWAPELEAPYYLPGRAWRRLIAQHQRHVAIAGPPLVGNLLTASGVPGLLWCASDMVADRQDRVAAMGRMRRLVHDRITLPWAKAIQARVLSTMPQVLGVSRYTMGRLAEHGCPEGRLSRLIIPVDCDTFLPAATPAPAGLLGFAARFEDPRKNLDLALTTVARLRGLGHAVRLRLAGATPSAATLARVAALGLTESVDFVGELDRAALPGFYQGLDLFLLPSHQEGLCIAGLEALATGVPVISTRCGGPEDYVRDGETGFLTDSCAEAMAAAVARPLADRALRQSLSRGARQVARTEFSHDAFAAGLARAWRTVWGEEP